MMARQCYVCRKELGLFNKKYECPGCGRTVCSDCVSFVDLSQQMDVYTDIYRWDADYFFEDTFMRIPMIIHPTRTTFFRRFYVCPNCAKKVNDDIRKLAEIVKTRPAIEHVSKNYRGRKEYSGAPVSIESEWYRDFKNALLQLDYIAAFLGCDMILDLETESREEFEESDRKNSKGKHYYQVFRFRGKAVRKA